MLPFSGTRVFFTNTVMVNSNERWFPDSRHRSRRIEKKLIKRYGSVYKREPGIIRINGTIYAHPFFKVEIEAKFRVAGGR